MIEKLPAEYGIVMRNKENVFAYFGWPSIAKLDDGRLMAVASGLRLDHVDTYGKTIAVFSKNDGKTWGPMTIINDTPLDDRDAGVINMGNNKIGVTWFTISCDMQRECTQWRDPNDPTRKMILDYLETVSPEQEEKYLGSLVRVSEDGGDTWGEIKKAPVTAPHGFIMLKDGTYLYFGKSYSGNDNGKAPIRAYASKDGLNWELKGTVPIPDGFFDYQFHEPHVIELNDGSLLGFIRTHEHTSHPSACNTFSTVSKDGGVTWSDPVEVEGMTGMPPHFLRHSSGAIICAYAERDDKNSCEKVFISWDDAKTWIDYILDDRSDCNDLGYPASVELSNGDILTVYYQRQPGDGKASILSSRWTLPEKK